MRGHRHKPSDAELLAMGPAIVRALRVAGKPLHSKDIAPLLARPGSGVVRRITQDESMRACRLALAAGLLVHDGRPGGGKWSPSETRP